MFQRTREQSVSRSLGTESYLIHRWGTSGRIDPRLTTVTNVYPWTEGKVTQDNLTPDYWKLIKQRRVVLPVNPFRTDGNAIQHMSSNRDYTETYTKTRKSNGDLVTEGIIRFSVTAAHNAARNGPTGISTLLPDFAGSYPDVPQSKAMLLQKALGNAKTQAWDLGTFVAELGKTADLTLNFHQRVIRRAHKVRSLLRKRSGRSKSAPDRFRRTRISYEEFSNAWLEYRYGWRILMYDVEDMAEAYYKLGGVHTPLQRYTAFDEAEDVVNTTNYGNVKFKVGSTTSNSLVWPFTLSRVDSFTRSYRAGVGLYLAGKQLAFIDPIVTGYEIIPFSFVADWFFNLGEAVQAWSPFAAGELQHSFVTESLERKSRWVLQKPATTYIVPSSLYNITQTSPAVYDECTAYEYTRIRTMEQPSFNLGFRLNLDSAKLVDFIALAPALGGAFKPFLLGRR